MQVGNGKRKTLNQSRVFSRALKKSINMVFHELDFCTSGEKTNKKQPGKAIGSLGP